MKRIIRFSRLFIFAVVFSALLLTGGLVSYFAMGGFNLGVDFQAGVIQEVQFAPTAFTLDWTGRGNAIISFDRSGMHIVNSGVVGVESRTVSFPFSEYQTMGALAEALPSQVEGLNAQLSVPASVSTQWLIRSAQGNPYLSSDPYRVHYLDPQSQEISIATVREALSSLGQTVSVQSLGQPNERHFMIRLEDRQAEGDEGEAGSATGSMSERLTGVLEGYFGAGEVVVLRSDYVGSRFSKNLTDQVGILVGCTLLLILLYAWIRFKLQYAVGAVLGIIHDGIVMIAFMVWTRMEFNTTSIAAILTIIGYSTNNTIVVFDRIRENRRLFPDIPFVDVLNRSLSETLNRTIITTLTTMLAVMSLFIFTTGSMKDFALALQVGMLSGVYTTTFIVTAFILFWEKQKIKREKLKIAAQQSVALKGAAAKA